MTLHVVILAGGSGSRMRSSCPKVLHCLAGKPLLEHVLDTVKQLKADNTFVVYGHQGDVVQEAMSHRDEITWVHQAEQLGTGHAVQQVLPHIQDGQVLILYGDVPMISVETLTHFVKSTGREQLGLLTALVDEPFGLGRVLRDEYRQVTEVVEERDATDVQKQITEINTGIYCVAAKHLQSWLPRLQSDNAQKELYLTDVVRMARQDEIGISVSRPRKMEETYGTNTRKELAVMERRFQAWRADALMAEGVGMLDPARVDIRGVVIPAQDCVIDVNVVFEGHVTLGEGAQIGPNCVIKETVIGKNVVIAANSIIEGAVLHENCQIGPFARIRPGSVIHRHAKVGNFVELKKTELGAGSKANHLSYVGDATIGNNVNIGAGVITCNYDGANKHQTVIEDNVFVGSDVQLVAPVTIGQGATVAAGTTVTKNVGEDTLAIGRCRQTEVNRWVRPQKA